MKKTLITLLTILPLTVGAHDDWRAPYRIMEVCGSEPGMTDNAGRPIPVCEHIKELQDEEERPDPDEELAWPKPQPTMP